MDDAKALTDLAALIRDWATFKSDMALKRKLETIAARSLAAPALSKRHDPAEKRVINEPSTEELASLDAEIEAKIPPSGSNELLIRQSKAWSEPVINEQFAHRKRGVAETSE